MIVYVSGPIKDNPTAREDFDAACIFVRSCGHTAINPFDLSDLKPDAGYQKWMRDDIAALVACDAIYLMTGWENSAGARVEFLVAQACGLKIIFSTHWGEL